MGKGKKRKKEGENRKRGKEWLKGKREKGKKVGDTRGFQDVNPKLEKGHDIC